MYAMRWGVLYALYNKYEVPEGFAMSEGDFAISVVIMILLAGAGNMINDYFDLKVDRVNKPDRIIVGRTVKRRVVMAAHHAFNIIATLLAIYLGMKYDRIWIVAFPISMAALLWFYSLTFQKKAWIGNFVVGLLVSVVPIWAGIVEVPAAEKAFTMLGGNGNELANDAWIWLFSYAGFAFWMTLIREVQKDMEDVEGDRIEGYHTIPIEWGIKATRKYINILYVILIIACIVGAVGVRKEITEAGSFEMLVIIALVGIGLPAFLSWMYARKASNKDQFALASKWTKFTMAGGILIGALMSFWF